MKHLHHTFDTAEQNLACDEVLLDLCEDGFEDEILRLWEPQIPFVVLGYSNKIRDEVAINSCKSLAIPILRRTSGGGTVIQGPGCLNYSLILKIPPTESPLSSLTGTNKTILERICRALSPLLSEEPCIQGTSDLTLRNLKFSGNAQRRKKQALLFHGTLLLNMDLSLISQCLQAPPRQPDYRQNRPHAEFVTNLGLNSTVVKKVLREVWGCSEELTTLPMPAIEKLVREKYSKPEWNEKF
ncbi:MAG: lipoate--protein ligase family protein [Candidatus Omnitrophica bacterium]|nr:lipoate--protein ligase family protein [Candidatus Omnitrophota bacterium]